MKKTLLYGLFVLLSSSLFVSCSKDLGNYEYHEINEVKFPDFQTGAGYNILVGETLTINPTLAMTMDQNANEANYTFEWSLRLGVRQPPPGVLGLRDSVISTDKVLKMKIALLPGAYPLQYRVTDKRTGVQFQTRATLSVTSDIYEGYMVLNEVNGQSRLDMLSYKTQSSTFVQYTDVLKKAGSTLPMQGQPYQILCVTYAAAAIPQNYGIFVVTSTGTSRINQETFAYTPSYNMRNLFVGNVPANFIPQGITAERNNGSPVLYVMDNGNVYSYGTTIGSVFKYIPLNVYTPSGTPFKVSPYMLTSGTLALMYNTDKRNFVTAANINSVSLTDVPVALNYPKGYDLIYMGKDFNNKCFALMKDPLTSKYWLMRFNLGSPQNILTEVTGTDLQFATNFALSPEWGYLFYSVGGKVYEYDFALQKSILMIDKGTSIISHLNFNNFYMRPVSNNARYKEWANLLTVGSYDPVGTTGSNGTLERYSIPPINGQIIKTDSWTGFGKIVSVAYRER